ncbi:6-cysteine protein [Plasmodium falciparum NF54]|uniref:Sporozoite surface protein P36p n=5 Tax=Plasmodium falciparum TaxID=5833 RepID=PF36P_PLAF7|nr:6-cysteine protein P52 [Plasmodium falciparum 3D7]Q8I1Y4.1 RecName: Full=Sporozoite surface protein P36p; AltName: Full=Sporozoite surface protein P52; Flags: Precursor [Plasmodium falciparum 3D7]AAK91679.1 Pf52 [Plasmodium falciparum]EWC90488.1 hypothetical protein PFNF54_00652 [Plasmodium falciparum NF54]KAF4330081.1 6-cysteine protein [Plasmodium falciparum NF54]PKC48811.1 6-cysteine protein [Plasmodium falciparum NF54]CAD49137.1 6-cysteine protein P52 [Plasmodium falciparum 3D7]|eukprot:XP_001351357.1 6-cysteine protein [Plasmodium falciparum 3D7]
MYVLVLIHMCYHFTMKRKKLFVYFIFLSFIINFNFNININFVCSNVIQDVISIGNVDICVVNVNSDEAQECILNNEFGKLLLFVCNMNDAFSTTAKTHPENCPSRAFVNQSNPTENSPEVDTYSIYPNLFGTNENRLNDTYSLYSTPYSNMDIDFSCLCYGDKQDKVKHIMRINIKKTRKKIKGCDFGDNIPSKRDLTNSLSLNERSSCIIHAYSNDVLGINCFKKEINNSYNNNLELNPSNCFHDVYFGADLILNSKNVIPNSRVIPDPSSDVKLSRNHSFSSYLILPNNLTENIKISCTCKRDEFVGTMIIYTKNINSLMFDNNNNNNDEEQIFQNKYMKKKEYKKDEGNEYDKKMNTDDNYINNEEHHNNNQYNNYENKINNVNYNYDDISKYINEHYKNYDHEKNSKNSYKTNTNIHDQYDTYHYNNKYDLHSDRTRIRTRTFWQNLFGLSSSKYILFNNFLILFIFLIYIYST